MSEELQILILEKLAATYLDYIEDLELEIVLLKEQIQKYKQKEEVLNG